MLCGRYASFPSHILSATNEIKTNYVFSEENWKLLMLKHALTFYNFSLPLKQTFYKFYNFSFSAQLCGSSCKHPPSIALLVIFLTWGFQCVFNVSLFRDTWLDNRTVFFSILAECLLYEKANATLSLSPINLLLLLAMGIKLLYGAKGGWALMQFSILTNRNGDRTLD